MLNKLLCLQINVAIVVTHGIPTLNCLFVCLFVCLFACLLASSFEAWSLYDIQKVEWHQLLPQFPTWMGMWVIVAFSSCLDVAAIEMELGLPLDYNWYITTTTIVAQCISTAVYK